MRWSRKRLVGLGGAAAGAAALLAVALSAALRHEPASYAAACRIDPREAAEQCDRVLEQAARLASSERMNRAWSLDLSERQINAWLAVDLPRNHAYLLAPQLSEPRVALDGAGRLRVAARYRRWGVATVLQLTLELELLESNVLSVRFVRARAGALPLPLAEALRVLADLARALDLRLTWREADGAPVALVRLPAPGPGQTALSIESLALEGHALHARGNFVRGSDLPLAQRPTERGPR